MAISPPFWKLPVRSIWGPVGGGQIFPSALTSLLHEKRLKESIRSLYVSMLPYSPRLRKTLANVSKVLAVNFETRSLLTQAGASGVELFLDCGVSGQPTAPTWRATGERITLLWAGRLEPTKGLVIAIRALAECKNLRACLLVAGSGIERDRMENLTRELGLTDRVEFLGRIPPEDMRRCFSVVMHSCSPPCVTVLARLSWKRCHTGSRLSLSTIKVCEHSFLKTPLSKFLSPLPNKSLETSHLPSTLWYQIPIPCTRCQRLRLPLHPSKHGRVGLR